MKAFRRITAAVVAAVIAVTGITAVPSVQYPETSVYASAEQGEGYFYNQLTPLEKPFYDAISLMNTNGMLKKGNADLDLVKSEILTEDEVAGYMLDYNMLLNAFGAARDAFYADHADIFYVDFSYLSIRTTSGKDGYHAYIGTGRGDSYYTEGFNNEADVNKAIDEYNAAVNNIVDEANKIIIAEGENITAERVRFVHDYITKHTSYRLENACKKENIGLIRTAYGSIVRGEAVCEGYSRAFKSILDRLGISCVLVSGIFRHSENVPELHMWTNVLIDGKWYGVDPTMDDPINTKSAGDNGLDGYEGDEYLLVGESIMGKQHVSSGIMSESGYEFSYPILSTDDFGFDTVANGNGLVVKYSENSQMEDVKAGEYRVSFRGMGVAAAKKEGWYFVCKMAQFDEDMDNWSNTDWAYILPDIYPSIQDSETEVSLIFPQVRYIEFAITDVAPGPYLENPIYTSYIGDPCLFEAQSDVLYNPSGTYVAPPYIKRQSPAPTGRFTIDGKSHHVTVEYDDVLVKTSEDAEVGYKLDCIDRRVGIQSTSGIANSKIENFTWDGKSTVSFDFTPSQMWADDTVIYSIYLTGLVGEKSGKVPNEISYCASYPCAVCAYRSQGYKWNVFGKPTLLENSDISTKNWKTNDGTVIDEALMSRLVLVATSPTHAQTDTMNEMIEEQGEEILSSTTYNINLTVCKSQVVEAGDGVRVSLGFPDGYGPEDAGVTFKAYHFIKNDAGEIIDIEEIPCVITPYGLLVTCKSFSPFAVVAVAADEDDIVAEKAVILSTTEGGKISGADSMITLKEGESVELTVSADAGYDIENVIVNGNYINADKDTANVVVKYEDIVGTSCIVDAQFITEATAEKDAANGEQATRPHAQAAEITVKDEKKLAAEGDSLTIEAEVTQPGDVNTYQWYKDGEPLFGKNAKDLVIESVTAADAGTYTLEVITASGSTTAKATSTEVEVVVSQHTHVFGEWTVEQQAGCEEDGKQTRYCTICREEESRAIEATGHSFGEWYEITSPSCTANGGEERKCANCGLIESRGVDALAHNWDTDYTIDKPATCAEEGSRSIHCKNAGCTAVKDSEIIPMAGHTYGEWRVISSPSCTADGGEERICEVCGYTESRGVDNTGHDWESTATIDKDATCTTDGSSSVHCKNCDAVKDSEIIPALGHDEQLVNVRSADCDEDGYSGDIVCEICDEIIKAGEKIPATGHSFVDGVCEYCGIADTSAPTESDTPAETDEPQGDTPLPPAQEDNVDTSQPNTPGISSGDIDDIGDNTDTNNNPQTGVQLSGMLLLAAVSGAVMFATAKRKRK